MKKTICELFAGVGGFRLGFERADKKWKTEWFSQWEPGKTNQWAHKCYVSHWGDIDENTNKDIAVVDKSTIPNHNLLVGGFPCQDYSVARSLVGSQGINGKKGVLWWQIRDTLEAKKAPFVLLENVDRLLKSPASQRGRDFGIILSCLAKLGYNAEWRVINAAEYGAGQRRRRVFIFAYSNATKYSKKISSIDAQKIILTDGFFAKTFPVEKEISIRESDVNIDDLADLSEGYKFEFDNSGYMKEGKVFTAKTIPILENPILLGSLLEKNVAEDYYVGDSLSKWEYLKGAKKILRTTKSGHQYTFSEGPIAFPDNLDAPARTMLTSESSLNRSTHLIKDPETNRFRILTPVEAERIQGFDDNWTDSGMPRKMRYFCMGNALVVPMITRMAKTLGKIFDEEK
ncbi:MAG: DNA (cytosine-5-)-methyltransferase [Kiritimatiellae bacterium]|nr:DNA (cytosine-5-)-methyltransferase [Kiritimatiellia bacterium]